MMTKSGLAIQLSKLEKFKDPSAALEQYSTDSEIAADMLFHAFFLGDIKGKVIADFGCGTGILGIAALKLGAKKVFFIDVDKKAIAITKKNTKSKKAAFKNIDVNNFKKKVNTVIQNPPFGVQKRKADKPFLEKAFTVADTIYSFHKFGSSSFIKKISKEHNFSITHKFQYKFKLRQTQKFHKKNLHYVTVDCYRLQANEQ